MYNSDVTFSKKKCFIYVETGGWYIFALRLFWGLPSKYYFNGIQLFVSSKELFSLRLKVYNLRFVPF